MTREISVLIVDDHNLYRQVLSNAIRTFYSSAKITHACNGDEAIHLISNQNFDIVLLDIQMPVVSGIEVMKTIYSSGKNIQVIILTQHNDSALITYMLQLGARSFLTKCCDVNELEVTMNKVMDNGHYYNDTVLQVIEQSITGYRAFNKLDVSKRELQVISSLMRGNDTRKIALELGLSVSTIESYRKSIMKKTNCHSAAEIVGLAFRTGLVSK